MQNEHAIAFLSALAGIDTVYDFRGISDRDPGAPGYLLRGTFAQCEPQLVQWQQSGYAPHIMINATDGNGRLKGNVVQCRAQLLDMDRPNVVQFNPAPHMIVRTSPGKAHYWWLTIPHSDKQLFEDNQRRLAAAFGGDPQFIDVAHTARLPGFWHLKGSQAHAVTVEAGPGWSAPRVDPWVIAAPLLHIDVKAGASDRKPLGTPSMAAPSWDWLVYAISRIDPNQLGFIEWIAITASIKQAGWQFGEANVRQLWEWWCSHYGRNEPAENAKQWNAIGSTASGWKALVRSAHIEADVMAASMDQRSVSGARVETGVTIEGNPVTGPILNPSEQSAYFAGCFWIDEIGRILSPNGRLMTAEKFNGRYGGKAFVLTGDGSKLTDEPWKAALRGQVFTIPKVDHLRFLPDKTEGLIVTDEFGRKGVNTYKRPSVELVAGDIGPFLRHIQNVLSNESDRAILYAFLAQCVQRPGVKVNWSILIQSMEGAGKGVFRKVLSKALGASYIHSPNAKELTEGGGKFNGWLRNKLMIIVDELKTDEKLNLVEVLKPMITDSPLEMQNKGQDQFMYDNPSNWLMFTNYKDAIPVKETNRRYCVMYSDIQDMLDLKVRNMTGEYYTSLYRWLDDGGSSAVAHWLMHYPIPAELDAQQICTRAPFSSTHQEVIAVSRSFLESFIAECVDNKMQGFRNDWVSSCALNSVLKEAGHRAPGPRAISSALKNLGYHTIGKSTKVFMQEKMPFQATLYSKNAIAQIAQFARDQGYE